MIFIFKMATLERVMTTTTRRWFFWAACGAGVLGATGAARGADTMEVWDPGAVDLEAYGGWDRLGRPRAERVVSGDFLLGAGVTRQVSVYGGVTLAAAEDFASHAVAPYAGLVASLMDTDHVDVDVLLDATVEGPGFTQLQLLPLLELNLDLLPDREVAGVYGRWSVPMGTGPRAPGTDPFLLRPGGLLSVPRDNGRGPVTTAGAVRPEVRRNRLPRWADPASIPGLQSAQRGCPRHPWPAFSASLATTLGAYVTLGGRHQFLFEVEAAAALVAAEATRAVDVGGVSLGYNVLLAENLEFLNTVFLDVPQAGEAPAVGVTTGFILGVPFPGH